jgi:hypothetical protein
MSSVTHRQVGDICHQGDHNLNCQIYCQRYFGDICCSTANTHYSLSDSTTRPFAQAAPFLLAANSVSLGVLCGRSLLIDGRQNELEQKFYFTMYHMGVTSAVVVPVIYLLGMKYGRRVLVA